ncbi:hypothetical protein Glove_102g65 [Diversispora epigaea]|uniref:Restriction endonuclease type IV Mrr domain-containing protein n=1 Tax=Diversispora epigaea TaxID=1348612 RepID=A0A397J7F5_9GLOM|nr:hypothetical protein Glove_102g65 [Diversispora epigaea]
MPKIIWGVKNNLDLGFGIGIWDLGLGFGIWDWDLGFGIGIWDLGFQHLDFEFSGPGNKGIDIKGMKKGIKFIIECKNWRTKNIDRSIINQIEGVLSRQSNGTIGIVVAPSMNKYMPGVKKTAKTSIYNVILVDN